MSELNNYKSIKYIKTKTTKNQYRKIFQDLHFIKTVNEIGKKIELRIIIAGGYAVDGNLKMITRPHNDIDIHVYGKRPDGKQIINELLKNITLNNPNFKGIKIKKDHGRKIYYYGILAEKTGLGADFYYIQIKGSPFDNTKVVIKDDGTKTQKHPFETVKVKLKEIQFEAQSPEIELKDKIARIEKGEKRRPEILQDIDNLKLLLSK